MGRFLKARLIGIGTLRMAAIAMLVAGSTERSLAARPARERFGIQWGLDDFFHRAVQWTGERTGDHSQWSDHRSQWRGSRVLGGCSSYDHKRERLYDCRRWADFGFNRDGSFPAVERLLGYMDCCADVTEQAIDEGGQRCIGASKSWSLPQQ